jgi:hypothetical protein
VGPRKGQGAYLGQPGASWAASRIVRAHVAHITDTRGGGWVIGCALVRPLEEDGLRACLR